MGEKGKGVKGEAQRIVANVVISTYGIRWVLDLLGWSFRKLYKGLITMLYT